MLPEGWAAPVWDSNIYRKHRTSSKLDWDRSRTARRTGQADEPAQYDPNLTQDQVRDMEIGAVTGLGTELASKGRPHKRLYYRELDRVVGASLGEKTCLILVEYHSSGSVHGRPVTAAQLRAKGATL